MGNGHSIEHFKKEVWWSWARQNEIKYRAWHVQVSTMPATSLTRTRLSRAYRGSMLDASITNHFHFQHRLRLIFLPCCFTWGFIFANTRGFSVLTALKHPPTQAPSLVACVVGIYFLLAWPLTMNPINSTTSFMHAPMHVWIRFGFLPFPA